MMRMIIIFLVCSIGVLFPGVLGADVQCLVNNREHTLTEKEFSVTSVAAICSIVKSKASKDIDTLKTCGFTKIDASEVNSFVDELCNIHSDLRRKFNQSRTCLQANLLIGITCLGAIRDLPNEDPVEVAKRLCKEKVFDEVFLCINDGLGKPCGEDGFQVVKRFTDAHSTYANSFCSDINGSPSMTFISWYILMGLLSICAMWKYTNY